EVESAVTLAPSKRRAVFLLKTRSLHRLQHAGFLDEIQAMGKQAFADGKTRKLLAFDDQHIVSIALEQCRRDGPGRTRADDDDRATFRISYWHKISLPVQQYSRGFATAHGPCQPTQAARSR